MGLKGDIEELKTSWSKAPFMYSMSAFLSFSSIASLSETIAKWKGFILDSVMFYRVYVSDPIIGFINSLNIYITRQAFDVLVIISIMSFCFVRSFLISCKQNQYSLQFNPRGLLIMSVGFYYIIAGACHDSNVWRVYIQLIVFSLFPLLINFVSVSPEVKKVCRGTYIPYYAQVFGCIVSVGVLAAINKVL